MPAVVITASPVGKPCGRQERRISRHSGMIRIPPPLVNIPVNAACPNRLELAAFAMASTTCVVMSPTRTPTRPCGKLCKISS